MSDSAADSPAHSQPGAKAPAVERWQVPSFEERVKTPVPEVVDYQVLEAQAKARGFEVGKWEGLEQGWGEVEKMVAGLSALADEMTHPFRALDRRVARELTLVAMAAARQIVRRELSVNPEVVETVVLDALAALSNLEGKIEIAVHPADHKLVMDAVRGKLEGRAWRLVEDAGLMRGGCRVKTPTSYIDASMETRLEAVFSALLETSEDLLEE